MVYKLQQIMNTRGKPHTLEMQQMKRLKIYMGQNPKKIMRICKHKGKPHTLEIQQIEE